MQGSEYTTDGRDSHPSPGGTSQSDVSPQLTAGEFLQAISSTRQSYSRKLLSTVKGLHAGCPSTSALSLTAKAAATASMPYAPTFQFSGHETLSNRFC